MALPRTLPSGFGFPVLPSNLGPFYANGNVYILENTGTQLSVWHSADPDTTAFAESDSGNNPTIFTSQSGWCSISGWLDSGGIIHVAVAGDMGQNATRALAYFRFDTAAGSNGTWSTGHGAWGEVLSVWGGNSDPTVIYCDIRTHTVSGDEWIEISYNGGRGREMGTHYDRVYLATFDGSGSTWAVDQRWDNRLSEAEANFGNMGLTFSTNRVHGIVRQMIVGSPLLGLNTITLAGAFNVWSANSGWSVSSIVGWGTGVSNGTACTHALGPNSTAAARHANLEFTSANAPIGFIDVDICDTALRVNPHTKSGITLVGTDVYRWYVNTDGDIAYDLNDATDVVEFTLSMASGDPLSTSIEDYTVGGRNVIGIIYNDGGTREYDEFGLGVGGTTHNGVASLSASATMTNISASVAHVSGTLALTGSATIAAVGGRVRPGVVSLTSIATLDAIGKRVRSGVVSLTGTATQVAVGRVEHSGVVSLTGTVTQVVVGRVTHSGVISLTGTATLVAVGGRVRPGVVSLTGTATIVAVGSVVAIRYGVVDLTASIIVAAVATVEHAGVSSITATATVVSAGRRDLGAQAAITGTATVAAVPSRTLLGSASLSVSATVTAVAATEHAAQTSLSGIMTVVTNETVDRWAACALLGTATAGGLARVEHGALIALTGTATVAAVPRADRSAAAALTGVATLVAVGSTVGVQLGAASLNATATLSAVAAVDHSASVSITGTATIVAVGITVGVQLGAASFNATATLTAVATVDHSASVSITGTATVTVVGRRDRYASIALTGTATVTITESVDHSASVSLTGTATVIAAGRRDRHGTASLTGTAILSTIASVDYSVSVSLTGTATMVAVGVVDHSAAISLTGTAALIATGWPVVYLRPVLDISIGEWTNELGQTTNLWNSLDEGAPGNPADWIMSGALPDTIEFQLETISDPEQSAYHVVQYGFYRDTDLPGIALDLDVQIRQGPSTVIASWTNDLLPTSEAFFQYVLPAGEANAITDYTDLRIRFTVREA